MKRRMGHSEFADKSLEFCRAIDFPREYPKQWAHALKTCKGDAAAARTFLGDLTFGLSRPMTPHTSSPQAQQFALRALAEYKHDRRRYLRDMYRLKRASERVSRKWQLECIWRGVVRAAAHASPQIAGGAK